MISRAFIQDKSEFDQVQNMADKIFITENSLPAKVFCDEYHHFRLTTFDDLLSSDFLRLMQAIAEINGDNDIYMLLRDPNPVEYYSYFQRFGALRFSPQESAKNYYHALESESHYPAVFYICNAAMWFGDSLSWGFYGERTYGIGIGAMKPDTFLWPTVPGVDWFSLKEALNDLVSLEFSDDHAFQSFSKKMIRQYEQ